MLKELTILYRGALETCNYACEYCPFAKRKETKQKKEEDVIGLERFINWVANQKELKFNIFFTPWGEALVFKRYQQALQELTQMGNVNKVIFQTNLSSKLTFLSEINAAKLRLWCTYHPTEVGRDYFVKKTQLLDSYNIKYSVGMVGCPSLFDEIKELRNILDPKVYMWINAYVNEGCHYIYTDEQKEFLISIDPLFPINKAYDSKDKYCFAGEIIMAVDEFGNFRRCHFIKQIIGNIYQQGWQQSLKERKCTNITCDCHIGYIFLKSLNLDGLFAGQMIERIMPL